MMTKKTTTKIKTRSKPLTKTTKRCVRAQIKECCMITGRVPIQAESEKKRRCPCGRGLFKKLLNLADFTNVLDSEVTLLEGAI